MAGHSKWSKVKHIKGAVDVKRGKLFSKLAKEIAIAAKLGGGDPDLNPSLRSAVLAARAQNMPNDNVERAIKRGTGEGGSATLEELVYEGYAPGGVALVVEVATDNRNRTAAEIRSLFTKYHGNLASSGSVTYLFKRQGQIAVPRAAAAEERVLEIVLEAGADEFATEDENFLVTTPADRLYQVAEAIKEAGMPMAAPRLVYTAGTTVAVTDERVASQVLRLCEVLDEAEDVQNVYSNFDISEELMAKLSA